ncbi:MAG: DUF349 domain-containing protein [Gammaproteobacteria bacterium]|nr:DUF349 domain-containing protein [Gammaproteobacteria bacterium]
MKLFQNLFTPKWKNKNSDTRKQALIQLSHDDNQAIFSEVVNNDTVSELRLLAVKRINSLDELVNIATHNSDDNVRDLAYRLSSQILAGISDSKRKEIINESSRIEKIRLIEDQKSLEFIAEKGDTSAIRLAAISKVSRESLLGDLAINDEDPQIRQHVAEKLHQKSTLDRVLKAIKNKDKHISKIIKTKLEQIIADEQRPKLVLAKQKALSLSMEQLGKKGLWERDKTQFDHLMEQWKELANDNQLDLQARFDTATTQFQENYNNYLERNEARLKQEAALLPIKQAKQSLIDQLKQLLLSLSSADSNATELSQQLHTLDHDWHSIEKLPDDIEQDFGNQFQDVIKSIKNGIKRLQSAAQAGTSLQALHDQITQLLKQRNKLKQNKITGFDQKLNAIQTDDPTLLQLKTDIKDLIKTAESIVERNESKSNELFVLTENLLATMDNHISNGEIKSANDSQKIILANIKQLDKLGHNNLNKLKAQSSEISSKLFELNKWRSWANTPQKERLINEIEALIDSDTAPKEVAFLVSKARKEWQQLGPSEPDSSQELWERFSKACDTAYEPCKAVFDDEAKIREDNYTKRVTFLDDLETFIDNANWDKVDWSKVENLHQQSRIEWQNLGLVDKNKRKTINSRFNNAQDKLRAHLISEWSKNQKLKEDIVEKSRALIEHEDLNTAIHSAKNLQAQWKNIGRVQHQVERKLWAELRDSCDKIFARRDSAKQQKQADDKELILQKETLCMQLETLCNAPAIQIADNREAIFQIKKTVSALPSSNENLDKEIKARISQALHIFEIKQDASSRINQINSLSVLKSKIELVQELEKSVETNAAIDWDVATSQYSLLGNVADDHWNTIIDRRFNTLRDEMDSTRLSELANSNLSIIRTSTIQLEIIAEIDTPESNSSERLKIQTQRLNDKLNNHTDENQWDAFINTETNWLLTGPLPATELQSYKDRHAAVINELKTQYSEELENY